MAQAQLDNSKVNFGASLVVQFYMVSHLRLSGTELIVYALIVNFSADGEYHRISLSYFQKWCYHNTAPVSLQRLSKVISNLEKNRLILVRRHPGNSYEFLACPEPIEEAYKVMLKMNAEADQEARKTRFLFAKYSNPPSMFQQAKQKIDEEVKEKEWNSHIARLNDDETRKILQKKWVN